MTATIFLARHGDHAEIGYSLSGRSEIRLSIEGRSQAARLSALCATRGVTRIQSSPRARTFETAEIVASGLGLSVEKAPALDEIDFGEWTGLRFADLDRRVDWVKWNTVRSLACPPGGETMVAATRRIVDHLDGLVAAGAGHVLCVTHCDMIRGAVAYYLGLGLDRIFALEVAPGSLSTLAVGPGGARLVALNEARP